MAVFCCLFAGTPASSGGLASAPEEPWPSTVAERSDYRATSRSDEVLEFIDALTRRASHVRRLEFGKTVEGRPLTAAVIAQPPVAEPLDPAADRRLVVLLLGNIHAGECDGKEALLMLMRELAQQPEHPWLKHCVLVFVPNFNADGNDRVRTDNRPGQVGPEEGMGQRANAQNLDLNRDFVKLETPECQQLVALINRWDPHLLIDTHTTDGSRHRYALTYDVPHNPASPASVRSFTRAEIMPEVTDRLNAQGIATYYYGNFNRAYTQWITYGDEPRHGIEYFAMRGRIAILAESYAYISYQQRIVATREFVRECLTSAASRATAIQQRLEDVRRDAVAGLPGSVPLQSEMRALDQQVVIQGFQRVTDPQGRTTAAQEPYDYHVDFVTDFRPTVSVQRPVAYVLPAAAAVLAERLRRHGVQLQPVSSDVELDVEYYWLTSVARDAGKYQGHQQTHAAVELRTGRRTARPGALIVPLTQPLSTLIVYLLEPQSADGLLAWDVFDPPLAPQSEYPVWRVMKR